MKAMSARSGEGAPSTPSASGLEPSPALDSTVQKPRAALHSLGCRLNHAETALIRRQLEQEGYQIVPWSSSAEVYVVNSCTVTAQADAKSRQALRSARRNNPEARVAVTGCFAQINAGRLAGQGLADVVVGNGEKLNLAAHLKAHAQAAAGETDSPVYVAAHPIPRSPFTIHTPGAFDPDDLQMTDGGTRAHLKIQDGCDFMCTFCLIPFARGRSRPRSFEDLRAEAEGLAAAGVREVVLSGVNLGAYDDRGRTLVEVVDALARISGLSRIRISSIEPTTVGEGLLERMADPDHPLVPFLHLPVQSGADGILSAMRRRYTVEAYRHFAEAAVQRVPGLCLGTDVMVGFPGEDDAAFDETLSLLEALPYAYFHVFPYSERKGTLALRLPGGVPMETRRHRAAVLRALSERKRLAFHKRFLGRTLEVLFERPKGDGSAQGYTANYVRVAVIPPQGTNPASLRNHLLPVRLIEAGPSVVAGVLAETG